MKTASFYLSALLALPALAQSETQPNIILFLVDDMGLMDTSVPFISDGEGRAQKEPLNDWYRTPSMERLAQQGTRISQCYAQSVSSPTRASLMTGQNSARHGVTNWINVHSNNAGRFGPTQWNWAGLGKKDVCLPKLLQKVGYRTISAGKAHFSRLGGEGEDLRNIGFDIDIGSTSVGPSSYTAWDGFGSLREKNPTHVLHNLEKYHKTDTHLSEALTLEAKLALSQAVEDQKPFFLYMSHYAAHAPFYVDKRFIDHYPESETKSDKACAFATLIEGMDKSLGDLMDHLEKLGVADNTLIIFVGDNGSDAPLGEKEGYSSSAPLRGKKGTCYEGGARVPFIAAWAKPDAEKAIQQKFPVQQNYFFSTQRATVMDIFPTITELAGAQNPEGHCLDGTSLTPLLKGENAPLPARDILLHFPHQHNSSYYSTLIHRDWKLICRYNPETTAKPSFELYHLAQDPYEAKNLASTEGAKRDELIALMQAQLKQENASPPVSKDKKELYPQS